MAKKQGSSHKYTGRNQGPARRRYTAEQKLMKHKVARLMRFNGLTRAEAELLWTKARTRSRLSKAPKELGGIIKRAKLKPDKDF